MDAERFLDTLFGQWCGPEALISIWTLPDRATQFFSEPGPAAAYVADRAPACDVYFGTALRRSGLGTKRGGIPDVVCMTTLWADFDMQSEVHQDASLPKTEEQVRQIIAQVGAAPTITTWSGHGMQAFWCLSEPADDTDNMIAVARRWIVHLSEISKLQGFGYDMGSGDVARVLRVPGTMNRKQKDSPVECYVMTEDGPRHDLDNLMSFCEEVSVSQLRSQKSADTSSVSTSFVLNPNVEIPASIFLGYSMFDDVFERTWDRKRKFKSKADSASEYDMALANFGVKYDLTDQQICDLIVCWRRHHNEMGTLEARKIDLAIRKARAEPVAIEDKEVWKAEEAISRADDQIERLKELSKVQVDRVRAAGEKRVEKVEAKRQDAIKTIDNKKAQEALRMEQPLMWVQQHKVFERVPIVGVKKTGKIKGVFDIILDDERLIRIGNIRALMNQSNFRECIIDAMPGIAVLKVRRVEWEKIVEALTEIAGQGKDLGLSDKQILLDFMRSWIERFDPAMRVPDDLGDYERKLTAIKQLSKFGWRFVRESEDAGVQLAIHMAKFLEHLGSIGQTVSRDDLGVTLTDLHFVPTRIEQRIAGEREKQRRARVRCWLSEPDFDIDLDYYDDATKQK